MMNNSLEVNILAGLSKKSFEKSVYYMDYLFIAECSAFAYQSIMTMRKTMSGREVIADALR